MEPWGKQLLLAGATCGIMGAALFGSTRHHGRAEAAEGASPIVVSPDVPFDASPPDNPTQHDLDVFSWSEFLALSWPGFTDPAHRGEPDRTKKIGDGDYYPTVWESYKSVYDVFRHDKTNMPVKPAPWTSGGTAAVDLLGKRLKPGAKLLAMVSKDGGLSDFQQAFSAPLIDQNGEYARYEIRMNKAEFDDIVNSSWWDSRNLGDPQRTIQFTSGSIPDKREGAIEIKAAWKILNTTASDPQKRDIPEHFHRTTATIVWKDIKTGQIKSKSYPVGLVGLHIAVKTVTRPQWIWSTFEQVENYDSTRKPHPSFSDPLSNQAPNQAPPRPWNPDPTEPQAPPTQVQPGPSAQISSGAQAVNDLAHAALPKGSVWQYYQLVSTEWPSQPNNGIGVTPARLGNTTMETYFPALSTCMFCHGGATSLEDIRSFPKPQLSDFSYVLWNAYPAAANKGVDRRQLFRSFMGK